MNFPFKTIEKRLYRGSKMNINPELTGTTLKEFKTQLHWRDTMNYAAAIGDNNPLYFDNEREGALLRIPSFPWLSPGKF